MTTSWHSYPKVWNLGHRAIAELFKDPVVIQEKVDGSQFSFGRFGGVLRCRSKGAEINTEFPEKMFAKAVEEVATLPLTDGYTYRGEYLQKPKHNALAYDRVPNHHVILFDVNIGEEDYLMPDFLAGEAMRVGLEVVPTLFTGTISSSDELMRFLETPSILGGQKIEGMVIKNYYRFGEDKKTLMGKIVSEAFKEVHSKEWKAANPTKTDVVQSIIAAHRTPARWQKAVQHLRERGLLREDPSDIGALIKEVQADVMAECEEDIKRTLFNWAKPNILRGVTGGLPEWYKERLVQKQFNQSVEV